MDRAHEEFVTGYYAGLATAHLPVVSALLKTLEQDEALVKKVTSKWNTLIGVGNDGK